MSCTGSDDGMERLRHSLNFGPEGLNKTIKQDRQGTCKVRLRCFVQPLLQWKCNNFTYCERAFIASCIHQEVCMRYIVICGVSGSTIFFLHFLLNKHKMCVLIFSTIFVWNISHSKRNWVRYGHKCIRSSGNVIIILVLFNETCISSTDFRKTFKYQITWKCVHWEPRCSKRKDRQTWQSYQSLFAILRKRLHWIRQPIIYQIHTYRFQQDFFKRRTKERTAIASHHPSAIS